MSQLKTMQDDHFCYLLAVIGREQRATFCADCGCVAGGAEDGLHVWLDLPAYWHSSPLASAAASSGIAVTPWLRDRAGFQAGRERSLPASLRPSWKFRLIRKSCTRPADSSST
ncbi:hypothetical protein FJQ89_15465 [Janthinobacterium tructae]|uniref:Uncharacterized protein n=1 Tax=Janthinobacterium tructae TaxID=2590869 RepID=A0A4Y6RGT7_9BURK|nr:hypothetical protein FJQ89_15465 [Janthinobacterium tructae]